jgi:hypothetical protein
MIEVGSLEYRLSRPKSDPAPASAPIPTTERQLIALKNLGRKQAGQEVDWINISDARTLTELGLAERQSAGWVISPLGLALLECNPDEASTNDAPVINFKAATQSWRRRP